MLNLHQLSRTDPTLLPTVITSIEDNRCFKKLENRQAYIKNINNLLNIRDSRQCALSTLNILCDHHTVEDGVVTEKTSLEIGWLEQLLKIIDQESQYHAICFDILGKLMKITAQNPDTNKFVQSKYVQKIVEAAVGSSTTPINVLRCLAICMEVHAGTAGVYKNKIHDYCTKFIDNPDVELIEHVALCLHLLQQTRGGSVGGGVYKKCWAEYHTKTINTLASLLERIKNKSAKEATGKSEKLQLPALKLSAEPINLYTQLLVRFKNVATLLCVALRKPFPVAKSIQIYRIIELIEDGVSMNQIIAGKKTLSDSAILSLVNGDIQTSLMAVLTTLMTCLRENSLLISKSVCDIVWKCLKQTGSIEPSNLKLRCAIYETLITFMKVSPNNFHVKHIMENAMKEALADITPKIDETFLIIQENGNDGGGRKKKKPGNVSGKLLKAKTQHANLIDAQRTCVEALNCLEHMLRYQGVLMKPALFYVLQEKVFAIGFRISSIPQKEDELYHDQQCRSALVDLVQALALHPVQKVPVPLNYCVALLSKVKHSDSNVHVRDNASASLIRLEGAIHSRKECFYFPSDYKELRDTLMFNKQTIHKLIECKTNQNGAQSNGKSEIAAAVEMLSASEDENENDEHDDDNRGIDENVKPNESKDDSFVSAVEEEEEEVDEESLNEDAENDDNDDDDDVGETIKPPPAEVAKSPPASVKRPAAANDTIAAEKLTVKKPKTSDLKEELVVEEMLADFDED